MPYVHVVLEPEVEFADHTVHGPAVLDHFGDESRDLLNDIDQRHRWTPIFLLARDQVQQQVSPIRQRWIAKLHQMSDKRGFSTLVRVVIRGGWKGNLSLSRISK